MFAKRLANKSDLLDRKILHEDTNQKRKNEQEDANSAPKRQQLKVETLTNVLKSGVFDED